MTATQKLQLRIDTVVALAIALAAAVSCLAPRASVVLLVIIAIAAARALYPDRWRLGLEAMGRPVIVTGGLLLLYMAASSIWALDPGAAASKVTGVAAVALCAFISFAGLQCLDAKATERAVRLVLIGAGLGLALVALEFASGQSVTRLLFNILPVLRPEGGKDLAIETGRVTGIARYELNRNVAVVVLLLWPAILLLMQQRTMPGRALLGAAAILLTGGLAFISEHETSMIAFSISLVVMAIAWLNERLAGWAVMAVWCLAFVLIIPLSLYAYQKADLHHSPHLPYTAQARIIIWGFTAEKVMQSPLIGIGVRSTRVLDSELLPTAERDEGDVFARRPGRHAHNLFLQSWFELGLIGAGLVLAFGVAVLRRASNLGRAKPVPLLMRYSALSSSLRGWRGACGRRGCWPLMR